MSNQGQSVTKYRDKYNVDGILKGGLTGSQQHELPNRAESSGAEVSIQAVSPDFSGTFPFVPAEFEDFGGSQHDFDDMIAACEHWMLNCTDVLNTLVLERVCLMISAGRSESCWRGK